MFPYKRILLKITGSFAAYKACELISQLKKMGGEVEVQVVLSQRATEFVGKATLQALTGRPAAQGLFEGKDAMDHIQWARWADCALVYPTTAHTIACLAAGQGGSLLESLFLAWELGEKPYFIAPAMNSKMWSHPATQKNMATLKSYGVDILPSPSGDLACGETGPGRLLEPESTIQYLSTAPIQIFHKTASAEKIQNLEFNRKEISRSLNFKSKRFSEGSPSTFKTEIGPLILFTDIDQKHQRSKKEPNCILLSVQTT